MKIDVIKEPGGVFRVASDFDFDKTASFKTGCVYQMEIKRTRNPAHHKKAMSFLRFCFSHWSANKTHWDHMSEPKQFDSFRKELTKLAGFVDQAYSIDGQSFTVEAKSLSYGNMTQDEFEECYNALVNAAIKHIFNDTQDERIINQLTGFF